jgi:hypothetical protein
MASGMRQDGVLDMPKAYNLFGLGQQAKSPNLTAAHRLNLYYDVQAAPDKTSVAAYGTPGLTLFSEVSSWPTLGLHWMTSNNRFFVVQGPNLAEVFIDGSSKMIHGLIELPPGKVSMDDNGTELCIFAGDYAYIYNTKTAVFTDISSHLPWVTTSGVELAGSSVTFLDGRFIAHRPDTGQFYLSALYDGLTWDALDYATAESNPDNLVAVMADKGNLALLGTSSIELWANGAPSDGGLAARWSLANCKGALTGLFRNRNGALSVCVLNGYTLEPIGNPEMDYLFNKYLTPSDAIAFSYTLNGRAFYQISFQAERITWLYDFTSGAWSQLKSSGLTRHLGDMCAAFATRLIVSSVSDGKLYLLDADVYTDNGAMIERELIGSHTASPSQNYTTIRRLRVDMEGGTGLLDGQGKKPKIMLGISRDHGHTWGRELVTGFGKMGEYNKRAEWRKLGQARDWVFKLRITDPVKVCILGAVLEGQELNK